jgi:His/Glu/Gln/Arg/opine family amino acid ABC transporter permease subunit
MGDTFIAYSKTVVPLLAQGLLMTLTLTAIAAVSGTLLGLLTALGRLTKNRFLTTILTTYVTLFRGTPLLLQILFFYGALPQMGLTLSPLLSVSIPLSLNAGAYIAEIIRSAIQSIDKGQMEAARSLGLSYASAMRRIVLPQTFRRLLPPMVNEMAALTKDTSLASVVGILELMKQSQHFASKSFRMGETFVWTALGYLIVTVALTSLATYLEKKLEARE